MRGEIYAFQTFKEDDTNCEEEIDSCYGWYSIDEALSEAKSVIDALVENND
jgi:hypothetical protein